MVYSSPTMQTTRKKIRAADFLELKNQAKKISSITCYDATFAQIIEQTQVHCVLVGDSLGHVVQGENSTISVTVEHIAYHTECVSSHLKTPLLVADMPFASAGVTREQTVKNATQLMKAGAEAVKIEGASQEILSDIHFLTSHGIPVMGHIGLQPQSVHAIGGYKVQGKNEASRARLLEEAQKLENAGCFAIVLELVEPNLAKEISEKIKIPTIGIGSGNFCDGNILVLQDMLGMNANFKPKFLKNFANLNKIISEAVNQYCEDVANKTSEP